MQIKNKTILIAIAFITALTMAATVSAGHKRHHNNGHNNNGHNNNGHNNTKFENHGHRNKHKYYDYARVIKVKQLYKQVRVSSPRRECRDEHSTRPVRREVHTDSAGNAIVGGIIGGVLGHQLGGGKGKDVATVAGTLIGATIGHNSGHRTVNTGEYRTEHRKRCSTHVEYRYEDRPDGYRVSYRYHGEIFHTRMNRHPGKRLRIKVQISLAD